MGDQSREAEEVRAGVYVCHCGGNIADVVDVPTVVDAAKTLPGVVVARENTFMCSDPGQAAILEDVEKNGLNRVIVAACSPKLHESTFRRALERAGVNVYLLEQANIREQVSWVHHNHELATQKAITLIRAAVAKAGRLSPLTPVSVQATRRALVLGGGVAGLRAARDVAARGIDVVLVEREARLGGFARGLDRLFPNEESAPELVARLVDAVERDPRVTIELESEVVRAEGYVGSFTATLRDAAGEEKQIEVGAVILATGFRPYEPQKKEYLYGKSPRVITLPDFITKLAELREHPAPLEVDGEPVKSVGFIHCVGSRQREGVHKPQADGKINAYCSRVCCTATLHAECELREVAPQVEIHDFYQDIRTYGRGHEDFYERAAKAGVLFYRYEGDQPPKVTKAPKSDPRELLVTLTDGLTWGEQVEVGVDLLVLAVGMMPADNKGIVESLKLPTGADRFLQEVHPKLQPVEQAVTGVMLAGTCQAPKDITESCASATAAASKAMMLLERGTIELDPYVAQVDERRCDGQGLCVQECEYEGAIRLIELPGDRRRAEINPAVCVGCGACVAVCPSRAIDINGWTLDQYDAMVDAIVEEPERLAS
jgi:heterodisulfide reductase subunit A2